MQPRLTPPRSGPRVNRRSGQDQMTDGTRILSEMNDRSREVFRRVVEGYLTSGDPVGSRMLTRTMTEKVSAATSSGRIDV